MILKSDVRIHLNEDPCILVNSLYLPPCGSTLTNMARKSVHHIGATSCTAKAMPAQGKPVRYAMSYNVGAISLYGRWDVCVSGLQRSTNIVSKHQPYEKQLDVRTSWSSSYVASTILASRSRPDALNLRRKDQ